MNYNPCNRNQMGFLEVAAGIAGLVSAGTTAFTGVYGTLESVELAKERAELEQEIAQRKMALQEELFASQQRILEIQTHGLEAQQAIELELLEAEAALKKMQLARLAQLEEAKKLELDRAQAEALRQEKVREQLVAGQITPQQAQELITPTVATIATTPAPTKAGNLWLVLAAGIAGLFLLTRK